MPLRLRAGLLCSKSSGMTSRTFWRGQALRMPGMADAKGGANGGLPIRGFPGSMGQFLLKGGMGGIPGMYESSDDEDFEGPAGQLSAQYALASALP